MVHGKNVNSPANEAIKVFREEMKKLGSEKPRKRTMTLNLSAREMEALEELCKQKSMTKTAIMRQALKYYQSHDYRRRDGQQLFWRDSAGNEIREIFGCCGDLD